MIRGFDYGCNMSQFCTAVDHVFNTLRPRQNCRRFTDDTFKRIFLNENVIISIKISLKFVPKGSINNNPALVQKMAWRRSDDKPIFEPMMVSLLTHICVIRPQWVHGAMCRSINVSWVNLTGIWIQLLFNTCVYILRTYWYIPIIKTYTYLTHLYHIHIVCHLSYIYNFVLKRHAKMFMCPSSKVYADLQRISSCRWLNASANALGLQQYCTNPWMWRCVVSKR